MRTEQYMWTVFKAAADYLDQTQGNVLLTTGSKELAGFTGMKDYQNRLYAESFLCPM